MQITGIAPGVSTCRESALARLYCPPIGNGVNTLQKGDYVPFGESPGKVHKSDPSDLCRD